MSDPAIVVEGLGKRYRIGARQSYDTLRDRLVGLFARDRHQSTGVDTQSDGSRPSDGDFIWALRDVAFEIPKGAAVGVIGPNGAGKSTLLKVLSRITEPTSGRAVIRGRVGSLLEVGTGFHPELSGRENIFLNGAVTGMRRREVAAKFASIVEFAGVERFLDTPVKRYSSGMYVRLAFAVAAHLEPEVLVVDEVLAVGDAAFQKRCLQKMGQITQEEGRTVLFVSHNLASIKLLTKDCMWLDNGRIVDFGPTEDIVSRYLYSALAVTRLGRVDLSKPDCRRGVRKELASEVMFHSAALRDAKGECTSVFFEGQPITLELTLRGKRPVSGVEVRFLLKTLDDVLVFTCLWPHEPFRVEEGLSTVSCVMDRNPLRAGSYKIDLFTLTQGNVAQDLIQPALSFEVVANARAGDHSRQTQGNMGLIRVDYEWSRHEHVPS